MAKWEILHFLLLLACLETLNGAPFHDTGEPFEIRFLKKYGYLSLMKDGNHNIEDALRDFQQQSEIPETGLLDDATIEEMHKPRCGVPDRDEERFSNSGLRVKRFAVSRNWTKLQLTYKFTNYSSNGGLSPAEQRAIVNRAFKMWEAISPLSFTDVTDNSAITTTDITLSFFAGAHSPCNFPFDGAGETLAHAYFPEDGRLHFDDDETFTDGDPSGKNLFSVALHEIGHLLGLKHSHHSSAIMHQDYKPYDPQMALTDDERHGIDYLYARGTVQPDSTMAPGQCADKSSTCSAYQSRCKDNTLLGDNLRKKCPQTCNQCGGQGVTSCSDIYPKYLCTVYLTFNICGNPFAQTKCQKTCTNCATG